MSDRSLSDPSFNMAAHVLAQGAETPEKIALEVLGAEGLRLTYAELRQAICGTAAGFARRGLAPGARILLRLGNTPDFPIAYLGAIAGGFVAVPTSAALTEREVAGIIDTLKPDLILRDPDVACPPARGPDAGPDMHPDAQPGASIVDLEALREMRSLPPAPFHMGDPERPGYIVYTSGTSGQPRAVVHAHRAVLARRMMLAGWCDLKASDRLLHAGAFNWTYTMGTGLIDPWTVGATALIPAAGTPSAELPGLLARHAASIFAAAPGVYRQALRAELPALPALRHGLSAGEKLPEETRTRWQDATRTPIYEAFGMSECSTFISGCPEQPAKPGALGAAQPGRRVAILGPEGPLPPGAAGTIAIHKSDPGLMLGYLDQAEETAARFQGDWFLTGDQGQADASGQITYLGRDDDMMNAGGFRVSPIEVEQVLNAHPQITASAAVELPVPSGASIIAAFYTGTKGLETDALMTYVAGKLARYKQPRLFQHVAALPTGANGKLLRRALRAEWTGHTWSR